MLRLGLIYLSILVFILLWKFWLKNEKRIYKQLVTASFVIIVIVILAHRTGFEIYKSIFGEPLTNCVNVIYSNNGLLAILDDEIILEFETCPQEVKRIAQLNNFEASEINLENSLGMIKQRSGWFLAIKKNRHVLQYFLKDKEDVIPNTEFYTSLDSTSGYYITWGF